MKNSSKKNRKHQCNFCKVDTSQAANLLELAEAIKYPRDSLLICSKRTKDYHIARIKLALDFERSNKGLQLRAMVERWTLKRIIREVY